MNLIPVIDLMQGQVVRAVRGNRLAYQPIVSRLCGSSEPVTVAKVLCDHCATNQLYVADLDALLGRPAETAVLRTLLHAMPDLELWLDAGFANAGAADALRAGVAANMSAVEPLAARRPGSAPASSNIRIATTSRALAARINGVAPAASCPSPRLW